jgi:hypothetical protein
LKLAKVRVWYNTIQEIGKRQREKASVLAIFLLYGEFKIISRGHILSLL